MTLHGVPTSHCLSSDLGKLLLEMQGRTVVYTELQRQIAVSCLLSPDGWIEREQGPGTLATNKLRNMDQWAPDPCHFSNQISQYFFCGKEGLRKGQRG